MSKRTKFLIILGAVFLIVGIPVIINELLQLTGSTFEAIAIETQRQADSMLSFGKVRNRK